MVESNNTYIYIRNEFKGLYARFLMHDKLPLKKYYNPNSGGICEIMRAIFVAEKTKTMY